MKMQTQTKARFETIQHDCGLIMEAIRRLIDGTWQLQADDQIYSRELFPKIKESLLEHIKFEEEAIFPKLSASESELHRADHRRLLAQLWSVEKALIESKGDFFQDLLRVLQLMLHEHHHQFSPSMIENVEGGCCSSCHAERQILARSQKNTL